VSDPDLFFWAMLINMVFYMPTIALTITVSYSSMKSKGMDIIKDYPPVRVFGTIGFIVALWVISLTGLEKSEFQFYVAAGAALFLGLYAFTLPQCKPEGRNTGKSFVSALGLNAFALFKKTKMALFFIFAMLLGASLQLTNAYGDTFIHDFANMQEYAGFKDLWESDFILDLAGISGFGESLSYIFSYEGLITMLVLKFPAIIMSISQISETLFILTIPFFLRKFGIKKVMLFSMIAWVLRFGLFAYGDPAGGLWMIILSCIIYGLAFDFFNISGSLFVETQSDSSIRASAQGLFMMMTNGVGAFLGSYISGIVIDAFFLNPDGSKQWQGIWLTFAIYSLVVAVLFALLFRHKHDPKAVENVRH
jgi:MFS transporter, NHS family, xanthosine permease